MCSAALSGSQDKQSSQVSLSSRTSISRRRSRKRRPGHRVTVLTTPTKRTTPLSPPAQTDAVNECNQSREDTPPAVTSIIPDPIPSAKTPPSHYSVTRGQSTTEVHHRTCVNRFGNELVNEVKLLKKCWAKNNSVLGELWTNPEIGLFWASVWVKCLAQHVLSSIYYLAFYLNYIYIYI